MGCGDKDYLIKIGFGINGKYDIWWGKIWVYYMLYFCG